MAKINKSLYAPHLMGGIERLYAIILGLSFVLLMFFGDVTQRVIGFIFIIAIWILMAAANAYDYIFFTILIRYISQQDYYIAHTKERKLKKKKQVL